MDTCCCKSSDANAVEDGNYAFAGGACWKPCSVDADKEHCLHVKESQAIFDEATRSQLEAACRSAQTLARAIEPCARTDPKLLGGQSHAQRET